MHISSFYKFLLGGLCVFSVVTTSFAYNVVGQKLAMTLEQAVAPRENSHPITTSHGQATLPSQQTGVDRASHSAEPYVKGFAKTAIDINNKVEAAKQRASEFLRTGH